ncbi:peptidase domain-containing ABC transporter [Niabella drilacis]|uniref:ATP-binding cassette, subfamily B n=1 Tax=Niabella drilacis (strain DSM 25811 / CCM 8410 / CCUG 62505 / LMG 26954 / E90) TaxID=1285928 RepID=A0A1G6V1Z1_NIADE|nr:peptidase domain-containing ABC transporter [Niabella drilacis]SDD47659.1 ATP-binding cassette, subfamily B [Niabella drilacis]
MKSYSFPCDRQLDMMDCGPACLKMIAKYYGKYYSLQHLRDKCGITKEGVSFLDLSHAAESIGLRSLSLKCAMDELIIKIPLPVIVHWNNSHFIVVYKTNPRTGSIYVADPAKGYIRYRKEEFVAKWIKKAEKDKGILMAIEPQADFYQRQGEERIERKKTFENFLGYFRPYKKSFINLFVVMLVVTALQGLLPFISKAVIDVGIQTHDVDFITIVLVANIAIYVSILLSNMARDWILLHVTARVNIALISDYLIKLMLLPITFFENKMTGDILQRAQDHERIRSFIMNNSINMIFSTLTFLVFGAILLFYNTTIFYIFLGGSTLYVAWVLGFMRLRKKLDWEYFELVSKNQSYWVETIGSIQDIKINNYEKPKRWKWEGIQARLYKVNVRSLNINNIQNLGAQFIDNIKNLSITFYCAVAVIKGEMTFGVMISTQFMIGMLNGPVVQLIQFLLSYQFAKISFLRLNEIHQLKDEHEDVGTNPIDLPESKTLIIRNLSFQYTPTAPAVLKNIYLIIPEGKVTAVVGDSGSGKSTLLKLVLRLYKPSFGEILIGNMNINNISLKQWRDKCGAVMQDGKIFNDTILNNIVLDDEKVDYKKLKKALDTANIAAEIERLPLGYQTKMGEQGRGLSGGQKQRILIARALYKDPDYLFFDEATNSLDTLNEQKIVAALDNVFKNKTVVVVAHRLSTIRKADQIVVMQDGHIVEVGNHDSLMQKKGRYYQLVQSQLDLSSTVMTEAPVAAINGKESGTPPLPESIKNQTENGTIRE